MSTAMVQRRAVERFNSLFDGGFSMGVQHSNTVIIGNEVWEKLPEGSVYYKRIRKNGIPCAPKAGVYLDDEIGLLHDGVIGGEYIVSNGMWVRVSMKVFSDSSAIM